jgi:hypothetical protein
MQKKKQFEELKNAGKKNNLRNGRMRKIQFEEWKNAI